MSLFYQQLMSHAAEAAAASLSSTSTNYLACHLYRSDHIAPQAWGLWISFHHNDQGERSLVVGGIQQQVFASVLQWARVTSTIPESSVLSNQEYGWNIWKTYFSMLPEAPTSPILEAGDTILSLNGIPIYAFGDSIVNVIEYMKRCNQLFVVAKRNNRGIPLDDSLRQIIEKVAQQAGIQGAPVVTPTVASTPNADIKANTWATAMAQNPSRILRMVTPSKAESQALQATETHSNPAIHLATPKHPPHKVVHKANCSIARPQKLELPVAMVKNPMFGRTTKDDNSGVPYSDNNQPFYDPDEDLRHKEYLIEVNSRNFHHWLNARKQKWRSRWNVKANVASTRAVEMMSSLSTHWTNPMFICENDSSNPPTPIPYSDNITFDPYDGSCSRQYLVQIDSSNFSSWLAQRKQKWRTNWNPRRIEVEDEMDADNMTERNLLSVKYDFWTDQAYSSFDEWLVASKQKWRKGYSWNSKKRKRIQKVCEKVVHFPSSQDPAQAQRELRVWLRVRKNQWKILRRKRQRQLEEVATSKERVDTDTAVATHANSHHPVAVGDDAAIDQLIEEEERQQRSLEERKKHRQPEEISFLFLPSLGLSDDVAALICLFLDPSEHGKLLCISKKFGEGLKSRAYMWQLLCNRCPHWHLPRRPRKPWHKLYLSKLREEAFASRKQWDDLLTNVSEVLLKGDQLKVVQKLIQSAEKKFSFTVDYISGVVCERNSILNLAVIHKRHRVVHWLVEKKRADLETSDRGHFTPLINAAWGGDKHLVRFLLQRGADRRKVGTGHYTEALAPSDFAGHTAEEWARKKGHHDIAELIRVGV